MLVWRAAWPDSLVQRSRPGGTAASDQSTWPPAPGQQPGGADALVDDVRIDEYLGERLAPCAGPLTRKWRSTENMLGT